MGNHNVGSVFIPGNLAGEMELLIKEIVEVNQNHNVDRFPFHLKNKYFATKPKFIEHQQIIAECRSMPHNMLQNVRHRFEQNL